MYQRRFSGNNQDLSGQRQISIFPFATLMPRVADFPIPYFHFSSVKKRINVTLSFLRVSANAKNNILGLN